MPPPETQIYLVNIGVPLPDGRKVVTRYNYIEERTQDGGFAYAHTNKRRLEDGHEAEVGR